MSRAKSRDVPLRVSDVMRLLNQSFTPGGRPWTRLRTWRWLRTMHQASGGKLLVQPGGAGKPVIVTMSRLREVIPGIAEHIASSQDVGDLREELGAQAAEIAQLHREKRADRARIAALERTVAKLTGGRVA